MRLEEKILRELRKGPRSPVCLVRKLRVDPSNVEETLERLEAAGAVEGGVKPTPKGGEWRFYRLKRREAPKPERQACRR